MGTVFSLVATATPPRRRNVERGLDHAIAWLHEVDERFTTYRTDSEWLRFARGEVSFDDAHPDIRHVSTRGAELRATTHGAFDLHARSDHPADPSAYVKGWSIDRAVEVVLAAGAETVLVNGGGDIAVTHRAPPWRIAIQDPQGRGIEAVIELEVGSVATSGTYERGAHLWDPRTARAADHVASVTVTGPDLGLADAYSTAIFVNPEGAVKWFEPLMNYGAFIVGLDGKRQALGTLRPSH